MSRSSVFIILSGHGKFLRLSRFAADLKLELDLSVMQRECFILRSTVLVVTSGPNYELSEELKMFIMFQLMNRDA